METKDTLCLCSDSEEQEMHQMQKQAQIFTESSKIDYGKKNESCRCGNEKKSSGNERSSYRKESNISGKVRSQSRNESNNSENDTDADATYITPSYDTKPMIEVPYTAKYNVFTVETQHIEQPENMNDTSLMENVDNNTIPDSLDMYNNEFEADKNADDPEDERVCKSALEESNDIRDRCRSALHDQDIELEKYKKYKNCQLENAEVELIMEYLMKISKKARILELKRRHLKITVLTSNTPYPSRKIRRICACTSLKTTKDQGSICRIKLCSMEVIKNGNSWVSVPQTAHENGTSVTKMSVPVTTEEKTNKKNDVKARSLLLMTHPNEHQLTFSQYTDAKTILPPEWNTHVVVWMNKAETKTMSIDDLYNNFKIVEQSVKKFVDAISGAQNLAFMTAPSTSSTNDVNTAKPAYEVSTSSPNVNTASPQVSTASFNDNAVYAFMVENPNGYNLLQQDLEQIHEDDLEAMDLKWQLSLLSMRAKRYYQRTGKKIFINANNTVGYDKSKVECFNCHKMGHFVRECRVPRNKEGQFRNPNNTRKHGSNEDLSSKAMLAIDGVGFDWSDMAKEQVQTNMALMAFSDSENDVLFSKEVAVLKREVACKDYEINALKSEFEKVKQEKEGIEFTIETFDKASKDLDKLLGSQIIDKSKKGLGYNDIPLPHPLIYNRPKKLDLSYSGLDEFTDPEFKVEGSEESKQESNIVCDKKSNDSKENYDDSLVKEQVPEDTSSFVASPLNVDKETVFLANKKKEFVKPKNHKKPVKNSVRSKSWDDSRHMTRNIAYLLDFKEFDEGYVTFRGGAHGGRISSKGTLKTDSHDFEDLPDETQILLKITRKDNMYSFDMKNIVPKESLTCLVAKATLDESML
ncbi:putative ribonuclease H-like domain-containing protein [Tanacetum coccineum]